MPFRSRLAARILISLVPVVLAAPAWGHSALTGSSPKDGASLKGVPATVEVNYAEPPTTDTRFTVTDGCGRNVAHDVEALNQSITADVGSGQPGNWKVEWAVVSAVDGHLTKDSVGFSVEGEADCDRAVAEPADGTESDSGGSLPVLPIAIATVAIIGIAGVIRLRSRS